ncbi:hypothetical protein, partial [Thermotoga sp.]|uniref:hypothetical protein n=1 Tax=Thermotoga sp. TaxID=28240 RepID=UPI0025D4DA91
MKLQDVKREIKNGRVVKITENEDFQYLATYGTFAKYTQNDTLKEVLASHLKNQSDRIVTLEEFGSEVRKALQLPKFDLGLRILHSDDAPKSYAYLIKFFSISIHPASKSQPANVHSTPSPIVELHIPADKIAAIKVDDELWNDTLETVKKYLLDLIDQDPYDLSLLFWLWRFGIIDEKKLPVENKRKELFHQYLDEYWKEFAPSDSSIKIDLITRMLQFRKLRYRVQHDTIKIAVSGRKKPEDTWVELLKDGHVVNVQYYLGKQEKKPLGLYHYIALFDLILRMIRTGEIKGRLFGVAKSNQKLPKGSLNVPIITNELIREKLGVNDYEATRIKNAIYDLSKLVIAFTTKDGTKKGIYPLVPRYFEYVGEETDENCVDYFELDSIFLYNGKNFVPMIPNSFVRLHNLSTSSRSKEFITNVFLYLLQTRNFKSNKCFISARSFSKVFPNAYAKSRRWSVLNQRLKEALQLLY